MINAMTVRVATAAAFAAVVISVGGCPEPYYDDDIGVEGVATDPGALAGTFAMKSESTDQADTILGAVDTGGITFSLVTRTWRQDEPSFYDEVHRVCDVENFETAGLSTVNSRATINAIPESDAVLEIEHATGLYVRHTFREYWAIRNLDDDDPIPTNKDSNAFYDMDEDGNPGTTVLTSGLVDGEVYVAQRKTIDQAGVVQGSEHSFGLAKVKKEGTVLAASNDLLLNEAPRVPHPDPKRSWWMEIRVDDDAGCDAVTDAIDSDDLPRRRPF
jgi:hypothetical protein